MTSPALIYALRWLTWDTFRQALASRIFALTLAINALAFVFCLGVGLENSSDVKLPGDIELYDRHGQPLTGPNPEPGYLKLAFGAIRVQLFRDGEAGVHFLMVVLAKWVAGGVGLLLALMWTAGFVPDFLQPSSAAVLLTKPAPRWVLLLGKYLGVVLFVGLQACLFFVGTWLALGAQTGVWLPGYLLGAPLFILHFAVVYSFSVLIGVYTRSTVASVFGAVCFWIVCFGANYARHAALAMPTLSPELPPYPGSFVLLAEIGYWLLPKPADLVMMLDQALGAATHFGTLPEFAVVQSLGAVEPLLSVLTSMLFAAGALVLASGQLASTEY